MRTLMAALTTCLITSCGACDKAPKSKQTANANKASPNPAPDKAGASAKPAKAQMETTTFKNEQGTFNMGQKIPDGFPLEVVDGATVLQGMNIDTAKQGKNFVVSLHAEKTSVEDATAFYKKQLEGKGLTVETMDTNAAGTKITVLSGRKDGVEAGVQVMKQKGKDGAMITVSYRTSK
jgi:hypothetical protein